MEESRVGLEALKDGCARRGARRRGSPKSSRLRYGPRGARRFEVRGRVRAPRRHASSACSRGSGFRRVRPRPTPALASVLGRPGGCASSWRSCCSARPDVALARRGRPPPRTCRRSSGSRRRSRTIAGGANRDLARPSRFLAPPRGNRDGRARTRLAHRVFRGAAFDRYQQAARRAERMGAARGAAGASGPARGRGRSERFIERFRSEGDQGGGQVQSRIKALEEAASGSSCQRRARARCGCGSPSRAARATAWPRDGGRAQALTARQVVYGGWSPFRRCGAASAVRAGRTERRGQSRPCCGSPPGGAAGRSTRRAHGSATTSISRFYAQHPSSRRSTRGRQLCLAELRVVGALLEDGPAPPGARAPLGGVSCSRADDVAKKVAVGSRGGEKARLGAREAPAAAVQLPSCWTSRPTTSTSSRASCCEEALAPATSARCCSSRTSRDFIERASRRAWSRCGGRRAALRPPGTTATIATQGERPRRTIRRSGRRFPACRRPAIPADTPSPRKAGSAARGAREGAVGRGARARAPKRLASARGGQSSADEEGASRELTRQSSPFPNVLQRR